MTLEKPRQEETRTSFNNDGGNLSPTNNDLRDRSDRNPAPEKRKMSKRNKAFIFGASALAAGGAIFGGVAALNQAPESTPTSQSDPGEEAPTGNEGTNGGEVEQQTTVAEISAGLDAETFADTLIEDRYNDWEMAGATDATNTAFLASPLNSSDFAKEVAAEQAPLYADALFVDGYEDIAPLAANFKGQQDGNAHTLDNWLITYESGDSADIAPYEINLTVNENGVTVTDETETSRTLEIMVTWNDNRSQNRIGTDYLSTNPDLNGHVYKYIVTTQIANGSEKIADIDIQKQ
jgi:hypothetical protein